MHHPSSISHWLTRVALVALAILLGACAGSAPDQPDEALPAGDPAVAAQVTQRRPIGVPDDFVFTPNGFFHPSCVIQVERGERVRKDGTIERADGSIRTLPGCAHPHYDKRGRVITGDAATRKGEAELKPFTHDWVVWSDNATHGNLQYIEANWTVPANPILDLGQTLFYFPGLQDSQAIAQPVLQYNQVGHPGWSMSSWFCCMNGYTWQSATVAVNVGDHLHGEVMGSDSCSIGLGCGEWTIYMVDQTTGGQVELVTGLYFSGMQDAVGGALEAYNVDFCNEFSGTPSVTFSSVYVQTTTGAWPSMSWPQKFTGDSPQCGYSESSTSSQNVTLTVSHNW